MIITVTIVNNNQRTVLFGMARILRKVLEI